MKYHSRLDYYTRAHPVYNDWRLAASWYADECGREVAVRFPDWTPEPVLLAGGPRDGNWHALRNDQHNRYTITLL